MEITTNKIDNRIHDVELTFTHLINNNRTVTNPIYDEIDVNDIDEAIDSINTHRVALTELVAELRRTRFFATTRGKETLEIPDELKEDFNIINSLAVKENLEDIEKAYRMLDGEFTYYYAVGEDKHSKDNMERYANILAEQSQLMADRLSNYG